MCDCLQRIVLCMIGMSNPIYRMYQIWNINKHIFWRTNPIFYECYKWIKYGDIVFFWHQQIQRNCFVFYFSKQCSKNVDNTQSFPGNSSQMIQNLDVLCHGYLFNLLWVVQTITKCHPKAFTQPFLGPFLSLYTKEDIFVTKLLPLYELELLVAILLSCCCFFVQMLSSPQICYIEPFIYWKQVWLIVTMKVVRFTCQIVYIQTYTVTWFVNVRSTLN